MNLYRFFRHSRARHSNSSIYCCGSSDDTAESTPEHTPRAHETAPCIVIPASEVGVFSENSRFRPVLNPIIKFHRLFPVATTYKRGIWMRGIGGGGGGAPPYVPYLDVEWMNDEFIIPYYTDYRAIVNGIPISFYSLFETVGVEFDATILDNLHETLCQINENIMSAQKSRARHIHLCTRVLNIINSHIPRGRQVYILPMLESVRELYL